MISLGNLLILGAGGHGKVVAETAMRTGLWDEIAFWTMIVLLIG